VPAAQAGDQQQFDRIILRNDHRTDGGSNFSFSLEPIKNRRAQPLLRPQQPLLLPEVVNRSGLVKDRNINTGISATMETYERALPFGKKKRICAGHPAVVTKRYGGQSSAKESFRF